MSQNLTQPEEIDQILIEMAGRDMKAGVPNQQSGSQTNRTAHDFACDWSIGVADSSCGTAQQYVRN